MYDLLLVYRVDRLARSVRGLAQILEELDAARVLFRSATEPFDTGSAAGRVMVQMLGVFAEFERATLIDRVVAGMERKAARGEWHGGKSPFGYAADTSALSVVDSEAAVVRQIFNLCRDQRLGSRAIANWLNEEGHRTRNGKPWGYKTILDMETSPFEVPSIPGLHPAIIDRQTFDACTAVLDERGDDYSRRASNSWSRPGDAGKATAQPSQSAHLMRSVSPASGPCGRRASAPVLLAAWKAPLREGAAPSTHPRRREVVWLVAFVRG